MQETVTKASIFPDDEEAIPVATFKNSLRQWQADWQAQHPADPAAEVVVKKTPKLRPRRSRRKVFRTV